jgi:hypothetical protein
MLNAIKAPFIWIADKWGKFNNWVAKIAPGFKTHITAVLAMIGNMAFFFKDYIDQLPVQVLTKYITADTLVIANMILISLIFWFRSLANKAP